MIEIIEPAEIPEPKETGSAGTQTTAASEIVPVEEESPIKGLPIAQRVEGLLAARPRILGSELAASLLVGTLHRDDYDIQTLKRELEKTREELRQTTEELSEVKTKAAVLQERVNAYKRERHLKNLSIGAGPVMIGIGIQFIRNNLDIYGYIIGILGILLLFFGWFSKSEEAVK
ncbi:MAG: hypothetical protein M0P73_09550 [Syntrophobacterales bacterium]|nr:hypothetical protein [Syntrophobacterales bacterium]